MLLPCRCNEIDDFCKNVLPITDYDEISHREMVNKGKNASDFDVFVPLINSFEKYKSDIRSVISEIRNGKDFHYDPVDEE